VEEEANVVVHDSKGLTTLHYAAHYGNVETERVILELGGNAHARFVEEEELTERPLWEFRGNVRAQRAHAVTHMSAILGHLKVAKLKDGGTLTHRCCFWTRGNS
jgi:ankyrin repeat protein